MATPKLRLEDGLGSPSYDSIESLLATREQLRTIVLRWSEQLRTIVLQLRGFHSIVGLLAVGEPKQDWSSYENRTVGSDQNPDQHGIRESVNALTAIKKEEDNCENGGR